MYLYKIKGKIIFEIVHWPVDLPPNWHWQPIRLDLMVHVSSILKRTKHILSNLLTKFLAINIKLLGSTRFAGTS